MGKKHPLFEVVAVAQFIIIDGNMVEHTEHVKESNTLRFITPDQVTYTADADQEIDLSVVGHKIQACIPRVSELQETPIELYMIRGMEDADMEAG